MLNKEAVYTYGKYIVDNINDEYHQNAASILFNSTVKDFIGMLSDMIARLEMIKGFAAVLNNDICADDERTLYDWYSAISYNIRTKFLGEAIIDESYFSNDKNLERLGDEVKELYEVLESFHKALNLQFARKAYPFMEKSE